MKQFMLLIRNGIDHQSSWSAETTNDYLARCESYINTLKADGKLISAHPLLQEGTMLSGTRGRWTEKAISETPEVIVGSYHVYANDVADAVRIAKANPEFDFGTTARVEVRPIREQEPKTGFVYPNREVRA